jgi:hypothetical protein
MDDARKGQGGQFAAGAAHFKPSSPAKYCATWPENGGLAVKAPIN